MVGHRDASDLSQEHSILKAEMTDLMLVRGIGPRWARILQRAGIETVEALSETTPEVVRMKLDLLSASAEEKMPRIPSKMTFADWIIDASRLRQKSQPTAARRRPSSVIRLMRWIGIDPEPFKFYTPDESFELDIALANARLQYGTKVILRVLFLAVLLFLFITVGYLVLSVSIRAVLYMDLTEFLRRVPIAAAGIFGLTFFHLGLASLMLLLVYIYYFTLLTMKRLTDRAILKLAFRDNDEVCLFAVKWGRACAALMRGAIRHAVCIMCIASAAAAIICLVTLHKSPSISQDYAAIPVQISMVFIAGLLGAKASAADSVLLRWIAKHPRSSNMFFGSNADNVRRWHMLIMKARLIDLIRSLCFLALGIGMIIAGTTLIVVLYDELFAPALHTWMDLIGSDTSKPFDYRIGVSELWGRLIRLRSIETVCASCVIFTSFYIGIPYFVNRGRGFLFSFLSMLCVGIICDFTLSGIRVGLVGIGRAYYMLIVACVYLLFKLMEAILSKKVGQIGGNTHGTKNV